MFCRSQGFAGPSACVLERGHDGPHKYGDIATVEAEQIRREAARYRWLRDRMMAADFDWQESGDCALVFEWPKECAVSGNCDATIDAAMLVTANVELTGAARLYRAASSERSERG